MLAAVFTTAGQFHHGRLHGPVLSVCYGGPEGPYPLAISLFLITNYEI